MSSNEDFKFKNQFYTELNRLIALHFCNINNEILNEVINEEQHNNLTIKFPTTSINQADDAYKYEDSRGKECGEYNICSIDENKQFSACLLYRDENYALPSPYAEFVKFDIELHGNIQDGFYIVEQGAYGDSETLITFNNGWFGYDIIKKLLMDGDGRDGDIHYNKLTMDKILFVMVASRSIRHDHFNDTVNFCYKHLEPATAKNTINFGIGKLKQLYKKNNTF